MNKKEVDNIGAIDLKYLKHMGISKDHPEIDDILNIFKDTNSYHIFLIKHELENIANHLADKFNEAAENLRKVYNLTK